MQLSMRRPASRAFAAALAMLLAAAPAFALGGRESRPGDPAAVPTPANPRLRLATTTSTENSGLLSFLHPEFTKDTGYIVDVVAVGTGAALKLGENADADVLLVHARALEDAFMANGHGADRRDVMYNDFIVIGPAADPAGLKGAKDAVEAFRKLDAAGRGRGTAFVSRGDNSGTHVMEKETWKKAGVVPAGAWYKEAGQGMEQVIIMADGLAGYALSDRATWLAVKDKTRLAIVFEGDPALFNPYGVIAVNPAKHPAVNAAGAKAYLDWLTSPRGQRLIGDYTMGGQTLFFPNYKP